MNFNPISDCMQEDLSSSNFTKDVSNYHQRNTLVKTYPWILDFKKKCLSDLLNNSMRNLMKLINHYCSNMATSVEDCYNKPKRAFKLKTEISSTLIFFHFTYKEINKRLEHFSFLEKMSDLMAMYVDMEIKASRTGIESDKKVASMITSSLKLYFGKYSEYILDSLLKTNLITTRCKALGDLIFRMVLRENPESSLHIFIYIRNILAYKMWKEIMRGSKLDQQRITELACVRLKPPIKFKEKLGSIQPLQDLFPMLPNVTNVTNFLMKAKFSSREKTKIFYKALTSPIVLAALNRHSFPVTEDSDSVFEKGSSKVDELLNNLWNSCLIRNKATNSSDNLLKNSKLKRKREDINNDIKLESKKISIVNSVGEDKHSIKLEIDDALNCITHESLYQYEHPIEDFFHAEEEPKDILNWKYDLGLKKENDNFIMKEDKSEDFDTSECSMKSDLEDEIVCSSNECLFDLKEDLGVVEGEKGNNGEHSSSLPLKKRRGFPYNKYVKNDKTDMSDMISDDHEERKMIFKTPAQLKAFSNSFNESTDLINLALGSHSVDHTYPVRREADSVSENSPSTSPKKKPKSLSKRRRRKGRGRPKKKSLFEQADESNRLLDELATTAGFFK